MYIDTAKFQPYLSLLAIHFRKNQVGCFYWKSAVWN